MISELQTAVNELPKTRKANRKQNVERVSIMFLNLLRHQKVLSFPREHLNFLLENMNVSKSQRTRTATTLLNFLLDNGYVREDRTARAIYSFRNRPLISADKGSYKLMMESNGYKRVFYKYVKKENSFPVKTKVFETGVNAQIPEGLDFDAIELKSKVSKNKQGVKSCGNLSVFREIAFYSTKKVYTLI